MDGAEVAAARGPQEVRLGPVWPADNRLWLVLGGPVDGSVLIRPDDKLVEATLVQQPPTVIFSFCVLRGRGLRELVLNSCCLLEVAQ